MLSSPILQRMVGPNLLISTSGMGAPLPLPLSHSPAWAFQPHLPVFIYCHYPAKWQPDYLLAQGNGAPSAVPLVGPNASDETTLRALCQFGPKEVIITLGERGSIGQNDQGVVFQKAFSVNAIDTTGAGDVYHGAYIYGVL